MVRKFELRQTKGGELMKAHHKYIGLDVHKERNEVVNYVKIRPLDTPGGTGSMNAAAETGTESFDCQVGDESTRKTTTVLDFPTAVPCIV
jgi:hypothetical protein